MSSIFASFDVFPSPKGAATHCHHTLQALSAINPPVTYFCLGTLEYPRYQKEGNITIIRCIDYHPNLLHRAEFFARMIQKHSPFCVRPDTNIHFRDIWSGIPLIQAAHPENRIIYEVNAFPSIELPYYYPPLSNGTVLLSKIQRMEQICLERADTVVTVSNVTARLVRRRLKGKKEIVVLPNTCDETFESIENLPPREIPEPFILYAGTLSPWQGLETLLEAFSLICNGVSLSLLLVCSTRKKLKVIQKKIRKLGLDSKVQIRIGLSRKELAQLYSQSIFTVAPLTRGSRNEVQGCSPLKIIESMAVGTPVIASDLEVCREIIENGVDGLLVTPDSPRALAKTMSKFLENREQREAMGLKAREKIKSQYNFALWQKKMTDIYTF